MPEAALPDITFAHLQTQRLNVENVVFENQYVSPLSAPHVEHLRSPHPATVIRNWQNERLKAAGANGTLSVVLDNASVTEERANPSQGMGGWFRDETDGVYMCRLSLNMSYEGPLMNRVAVKISAEASQAVRESANVNERDLAYFQTVEIALQKLDEETSKVLSQYFAPLMLP